VDASDVEALPHPKCTSPMGCRCVQMLSVD
jgi:hypothetical protein